MVNQSVSNLDSMLVSGGIILQRSTRCYYSGIGAFLLDCFLEDI